MNGDCRDEPRVNGGGPVRSGLSEIEVIGVSAPVMETDDIDETLSDGSAVMLIEGMAGPLI